MPVLISNETALALSQNPALYPPRPTGMVFSVYPAAYPGPIVLSNPGTIVPWAPGIPTEIGR